jgi:hypothetical protein
MKFIEFCEEVLRVPENVTFWIMSRSYDYSAPYCVNMSILEKPNSMGEPCEKSIIRSEGYKTLSGAKDRLKELLKLLNQP